MRTLPERFPSGWPLAALLILVTTGLAACGGSGYGSGGGNMPVAGVGPSKLFAADSMNMAIGSLANPNPAAGMLAPDRMITDMFGYAGLSSNMGSLALDAAGDRLYAGTGTSIVEFDGASGLNGYPFFTRRITITGNTGSLFLDTTNDRLYVGNDTAGVQVFNAASMANGAPAANRTLTGFGAGFQILGVAVDTAKNILYVSNTTTGPSYQVSVFDNAGTVNNADAPNRTITPTLSSTAEPVGGIALDATNDILYVAGGATSSLVMAFTGASAANDTAGAATPSRTMTFPTNISKIVLDVPNDRLYAIGGGTLYILNGVSAASGTVMPAALTLSGGNITAVAVKP
ncbi:MAG TPA: hypothetical protein VFK92_06780 [Burkholderiales bacterium]|nr:hypothetical protein [Burkholderiales bacterium]